MHTKYERKSFRKERNKKIEILNENELNIDENMKKDNNSHEHGLREATEILLCA